jgi:hypothetical protein
MGYIASSFQPGLYSNTTPQNIKKKKKTNRNIPTAQESEMRRILV